MTYPRRKRGTGAIEQLANGTFCPRMPGNGGRLRVCATHAEATELLNATIIELDQEGIPASGKKTLRLLGDDFLASRRKKRAWGTDVSRWNQHIATADFADWPLDLVQPFHVRKWLEKMQMKRAAPGKGHDKKKKRDFLGRSTIANTLNLIRCAFRYAVDETIIQTNPATDVKMPDDEGETYAPWTWLEPREQEAILNCEDIPLRDRLLIAFAMGTGLRQGELWNLELSDVLLDAKKVVVRFGSKGNSTKGKRIRRTPLFGIALEAIEAWLPMLKKQKNPHKLVWPLPSGARRQKGKRPKKWNEWLKKAGIVAAERHDKQPVRWHDLRHTCGSSLVAGWWGRRWSILEVRDMLGHRSVTTSERYAHLSESALDAAARDTYLPEISPASETPNEETSMILGAPPARIGRATFGLGNLSHPEALREVVRLRGEIAGSSRLAVEALQALGSGDPAGEAAAIRKLGAIAAKTPAISERAKETG